MRQLCGITALDECTAIAGWRTEVRRYKSKVEDARLESKSRRPLQIQKQNQLPRVGDFCRRLTGAFDLLQERRVERAGQKLAGCFLFYFSF